jgi:di- and tripeptidase
VVGKTPACRYRLLQVSRRAELFVSNDFFHQWCQLAEADGRPKETLALHPADRRHRFFDSRGPDGSETPRSDRGSSYSGHSGLTLTFKRDQHRLFSHYGYIYAMALVRGLIESTASEEVLLTGSGDGTVKIWRLSPQANGAPLQLAKLNNGSDAVLSIDIEGPLLYCGLENGSLNIWNLESSQLVKQMASHSGELWTIDIFKGFTLTGDSTGVVKVS